MRFERSDRKKNFVVYQASKECGFKVHAYWKTLLQTVQVTKVVATHMLCLGTSQPSRNSLPHLSRYKKRSRRILSRREVGIRFGGVALWRCTVALCQGSV